jgi:hypothetical protein
VWVIVLSCWKTYKYSLIGHVFKKWFWNICNKSVRFFLLNYPSCTHSTPHTPHQVMALHGLTCNSETSCVCCEAKFFAANRKKRGVYSRAYILWRLTSSLNSDFLCDLWGRACKPHLSLSQEVPVAYVSYKNMRSSNGILFESVDDAYR